MLVYFTVDVTNRRFPYRRYRGARYRATDALLCTPVAPARRPARSSRPRVRSPRSASLSGIPGPSGIVAQLVTQAAAAASASSAATVWIGTYEPSASSSSGAASSCSNTRASGGVADGQSHVSNEQGAVRSSWGGAGARSARACRCAQRVTSVPSSGLHAIRVGQRRGLHASTAAVVVSAPLVRRSWRVRESGRSGARASEGGRRVRAKARSG
jgi:hypothetical protein